MLSVSDEFFAGASNLLLVEVRTDHRARVSPSPTSSPRSLHPVSKDNLAPTVHSIADGKAEDITPHMIGLSPLTFLSYLKVLTITTGALLNWARREQSLRSTLILPISMVSDKLIMPGVD